MATEQQKRDALVEQGGRAYHLGIERHNCPLNEPSSRQLWVEGWDKAKKAFEALFPAREGRSR
jgi:ribosome modulation factor